MIDRLEVYDIQGHLIKYFDFTEKENPRLAAFPPDDQFVFLGVAQERTHVKSFYITVIKICLRGSCIRLLKKLISRLERQFGPLKKIHQRLSLEARREMYKNLKMEIFFIAR